MAYIITSQCISCDRCVVQCPTGAIKKVGERYTIDPNLCNNCVGHYSVPLCAATCPTNDGCVPDVVALNCNHPVLANGSTEYWDSWFSTYNRLVAQLHKAKQSGYWYQWFDRYSQAVSQHLSQRKHQTAGVQA